MKHRRDEAGIANLVRRLKELVCEPTEGEGRDNVYHTRVHAFFSRRVSDTSTLTVCSAGQPALKPESRIF